MTTTRLITCHSILQLDLHHPYAAPALTDAHQMHRIVMSGFKGWVPDGQRDARAQLGVLSTWSADLKTNTLLIVVQSRVRPDWTTIPRTALRQAVDVRNIDHPIITGDPYTFRTVVNAVHTVRTPSTPGTPHEKTTSKRLPHVHPEHVRRWLEARLHPTNNPTPTPPTNGIEHIGADADRTTLAIRMLPPVQSDHHKGLKINRAEIRGTLTVTHPTRFTTTLTNGLGKARAYSCGLILTKPTTL
ncbi:type I-E CRISPR-associated protein Cas6/Cse3/CasE [Streptomyces hydrogenans]|uniref:type I-E CRISPR-associated protein Cas6/Cse3/CasE n=1 Tax=Streptomyces hydrogenans TaxID=1873719 RepID=UPI003811F1F0